MMHAVFSFFSGVFLSSLFIPLPCRMGPTTQDTAMDMIRSTSGAPVDHQAPLCPTSTNSTWKTSVLARTFQGTLPRIHWFPISPPSFTITWPQIIVIRVLVCIGVRSIASASSHVIEHSPCTTAGEDLLCLETGESYPGNGKSNYEVRAFPFCHPAE